MTARARRRLDVFVAQAHAGELRMAEDGALTFQYDQSYAGPDLSVRMPFSSGEYAGKSVYAWFDNLLPDDRRVRQGMAAEAGTSTGVFPLLANYGADLPGAVQVVASDDVGSLLNRGQGYVRLSRTEIAARLRRIMEDEDAQRARTWARSDEHWSLGGMQTKIALREFDGQWYECLGSSASNVIVKPGAWGLEGQAFVECLTMELAKRCGLPTASVRVEPFDEISAIVVQRYDRFTAPTSGLVTRIHQEDLCQATGTVSAKKYAADGGPSAPEVMGLLRRAEGGSASRFVDALLFNCLTASTDAHAKNYSVLHPRRSEYLLAPLYDLASAAPYMGKGKTYRLAMAIGGENRVGWLRKSSLERFAQANGLDSGQLADRADELAELIKDNLEPAADELARQPGSDALASLLICRLRALCDATQRNIRVDGIHFKPVDIARFGIMSC
ncbi:MULTISPECIES: HipA domain-containing protein [unclassified Adlercreutzia]|uniref:HipA domain-containing protein n=1 Tax=unclassified Adlercreutzia TaxID=2636013 RepID=UPI0013ECF3D5|nr:MULTISPECIES: HipA domain-containing protein [unclassified Adlercreutzia]